MQMHGQKELFARTPDAFFARCSALSDADTIIVDFDETLWFRNSTEVFLASARPSIVAAVILQIVGFLKPWALFGPARSEALRDLIRVSAILFLMPWTLPAWKKKAQLLGPKHMNVRLLEELRANKTGGPVILVATLGFRIIVQPLLETTGLDLKLIAASSLRDAAKTRRMGKGATLVQNLPEETLRNAVFVTDSVVDKDVFEFCCEAYLVSWPEAEFAMAGRYPCLPFVYTTKVKRPTENYILHGVIGYDLVVGLLAFTLFSDTPILSSLAFAFFLIGFFAVYEIGYFENDTVATKREAKPMIPANQEQFADNFSIFWAWTFGVSFCALGSSILAYAAPGAGDTTAVILSTAATYFFWSCVLLVVTRLTFFWFNRSRPTQRIVPMGILQLERTLGYALIFPLTWVGAVLCVAHAAGRWFPYIIYRFGGERRNFPSHLFAFLAFIGLCFSAFLLVPDWQQALSAQFVVVAAYLLLRAAKDALRFGRHDDGKSQAASM